MNRRVASILGSLCVVLPIGCLAPALRPAEMADLGQVVASVGGMFPDGQNSASRLEGSATVAVGILPHLQLEAAGVLDQGDPQSPNAGLNWRLGGGLRGAIPLGTSRNEIQIAGLFDLGRSTDVFSTGGCWGNNCSQTEFFDERRATVEAGWVHNFDRHHGAVGIFVDGFASFLEETTIAEDGNCRAPFYRSDFAVGGLGSRFSLDVRPFDAAPWLGVLLGASAGGPGTSAPGDLSELLWFDAGVGLLFVL